MQPALERPAKAERCSALHADTPTRRYAPRRGPVNQSPSLRYSPKKPPLLLLRSARRGLPAPSGRVGHIERIKTPDRKSTRLNSSHQIISYAVFCLKKKKKNKVMLELSVK